MKIVEYRTDEEFASIWPFIKMLNPTMKKREFNVMLPEMLKDGFRVAAIVENGNTLGISGFWIGYKFYSRKFLHIDAFCVAPEARSKGVGKKLLDWMEKLAAKEKCNMIVLNTYATNTASHKFYAREDYVIAGYHFLKKL